MVKICIIGAGAAGIVTAKLAVKEGHEVIHRLYLTNKSNSKVKEKCKGPFTLLNTSPFNVLTNLPKEIMFFSDVKFSEDLPSFMDHQDVFEYLKSYAKGLPILLNHTVTSVKPINNKWEVTVSHKGNSSTELFDVVFICNGHFFNPSVPLDHSKFNGSFIHSQDYRKASSYKDRRVAVIGAATSGIDISMQAAEYADKVYVIGSKASYAGLCENVANLVQIPFRVNGLNSIVVKFTLFEQQDKYALAIVGERSNAPSTADLESWQPERLRDLRENGLSTRQFHILEYDEWAILTDSPT